MAFPKLMVVSSLEENITWLNVFPKKNGISNTLSPSTIVIGTPKIDANHATLKPGSYVYCNIDKYTVVLKLLGYSC